MAKKKKAKSLEGLLRELQAVVIVGKDNDDLPGNVVRTIVGNGFQYAYIALESIPGFEDEPELRVALVEAPDTEDQKFWFYRVRGWVIEEITERELLSHDHPPISVSSSFPN